MNYRVLIVDDDPDILEFVGYSLTKEGYDVETAADGLSAVAKAAEWQPHLILLDVMMPNTDGFEACRMIRKTADIKDTLIIFLTARSEENFQVRGFDCGADDYITKPIQLKVLASRIKAVLKRKEYPDPDSEVTIDHERHVVIKGGLEVMLPRKEFNLLSLLQSKPGKLFTREQIYSTVWGDDVVVGERTIDVHIRNLRKKIGEGHIATVKGVGYKYEI